jgi:hypothetical protein
VTEIFDCSQVPEDQRVDIDNGKIWVEGMHQTLELPSAYNAAMPHLVWSAWRAR